MSSNAHRETETFFRKHEDVLANFIADPDNFVFEVPLQTEPAPTRRICGATVAVNLTFAIKYFLRNPACPSSYFTYSQARDFDAVYCFRAHESNYYAAKCFRRATRGTYKKPAFTHNPVAPKDESQRIVGLGLPIANLELFRSVLQCYKHKVITWPISFDGKCSTIHEEYIAELGDFVDPCYIDQSDTTILVPISP